MTMPQIASVVLFTAAFVYLLAAPENFLYRPMWQRITLALAFVVVFAALLIVGLEG